MHFAFFTFLIHTLAVNGGLWVGKLWMLGARHRLRGFAWWAGAQFEPGGKELVRVRAGPSLVSR